MFDECLASFVEEVMPFAVLLHSVFSVAVFSAAPAYTNVAAGTVPGLANATPSACIAAPIAGLVINVVAFIFFELWELNKDEEVPQVKFEASLIHSFAGHHAPRSCARRTST